MYTWCGSLTLLNSEQEEREILFSRSSLLYLKRVLRSNSVTKTWRKSQKEQREIFLRTGGPDATTNHPSKHRAEGMDPTGIGGPVAAPPARARSFSWHRQKIY